MILSRHTSTRLFRFLCYVLMSVVLIFIQAYFLSTTQNRWLHIDFLTIVIVYVSIEHYMLDALGLIIFSSFILHSLSLVTAGFFPMYYLIVFVISNFLSRHFILNKQLNQLIFFTLYLFLKYILFFFSLANTSEIQDFISFFTNIYPAFIAVIFVIPCFKLLDFFDSFFDLKTLKANDDFANIV